MKAMYYLVILWFLEIFKWKKIISILMKIIVLFLQKSESTIFLLCHTFTFLVSKLDFFNVLLKFSIQF